MASKIQERDTTNRFASMFKKGTSKSEDQHSDGRSMKQRVSKLFSRIGRWFRKVQVSELSYSPSFLELPQKSDTQISSPKVSKCSKHDEFRSNEVTDLTLKIKELPQQAGKMGTNISALSSCLDELSPPIAKLSPKQNGKLSPKKDKLRRKKRSNVGPEVFTFPTVPELHEVKNRRETRKPQRFRSETAWSTYKNIKDQNRQRVVSEPCINKYAELIASRGIQLTEAANELTEEECRLLYEDIFKPLDVLSILQERSQAVYK